MNTTRRRWVRLAASLSVVAVLAPAAHAQVASTEIYHQISAITSPIIDGGGGAPILSRDGQHIAFSRPPVDGDLLTRISVVNFDGSGQTEVDSYPGYGPWLDISADGSKVISSDTGQLRIANGDGSGALPLLALASPQISAIAISGDGSTVFFQVNADTVIRDSNPPNPVQRGVWVINGDGSGLQQLVSPDQMQALGIPPNPAFGGNSNPPVLASAGSQLIFGAFNDPQSAGFGQGLFAVNGDGSGLQDLLGRVGFVKHGGISSDGTKVFYDITTLAPGNEVGVLNADGTGRLVLVDDSRPGLLPGTGDRVQLSGDGSLLLLGTIGVLASTDGSAVIQLAITTPPGGDALSALLYNQLFRATMSDNATRVAYFALPFGQPRQLATLEMNPASLGDAPSITNPTIDPPFVLTRGRSASTVSALVSANSALLTVGNTVLLNGLDDPNVTHQIMSDTGSGVFTNNNVFAGSDAMVGPRTVRVQSGVLAGDNKLHATAVEFGPFAVLEDVPGRVR